MWNDNLLGILLYQGPRLVYLLSCFIVSYDWTSLIETACNSHTMF